MIIICNKGNNIIYWGKNHWHITWRGRLERCPNLPRDMSHNQPLWCKPFCNAIIFSHSVANLANYAIHIASSL